MRKTLLSILALILLTAAPAGALEPAGGQFPQLKLPDTSGRIHDVNALIQGKVALVVYWSVSCPICGEEIPHLVKLAERLAGNPLVLLSISTDGEAMASAVAEYARWQGLPQPVLMDNGPNDAVPYGDALDIIATPCIAVVDAGGKIVYLQEYHPRMEDIERAVTSALSGSSGH